jgi:hypothetical protein
MWDEPRASPPGTGNLGMRWTNHIQPHLVDPKKCTLPGPWKSIIYRVKWYLSTPPSLFLIDEIVLIASSGLLLVVSHLFAVPVLAFMCGSGKRQINN